MDRERYINGLTDYRNDRTEAWIEHFAVAAARAAQLAAEYLDAVKALVTRWRTQLAQSSAAPRRDGVAWALIDSLPAHPIITAPAAVAATGRSKPQVYQALKQLEAAAVLKPLSGARRNQSWEAAGLLDLLGRLDAGELPPSLTDRGR